MDQIEFRQINNKTIWEDYLKSNNGNFLQSWYWGELNQNLGNKIKRYGYYKKNLLVGICLLINEKSKRANYIIIPAGPIIDWQNNKLTKIFKQSAVNFAHESKSSYIRCRPQYQDNKEIRIIFKSLDFIKAPMHLEAELTLQIDLNQPKETILAQMRKQTRYEIRKATKLGIEIKKSTNVNDIKSLYDIQLKTAKRHNFIPFSYQRLSEQFKIFSKSHHAILYSAYYQKKLLAIAFIIFYNNEAVYHYGAGTDEGRNYPGAYLIQWQVICDAKKMGFKFYNLWGVAPEEEKNHRFYNLSVFKRGFGGIEVNYLHAQDLVTNKLRYLLNFIIETARRKYRRL